jgi:hypothetical protein
MKRYFKLTIDFTAEIDTGRLKGDENPIERHIKTFLAEIVKYPDAVMAFYKSFYLDYFISSTGANHEKFQSILDIRDYEPYFIKIGNKCPGDTRDFIHTLYTDKEAKTICDKAIDDVRDELEGRFKDFEITEATFEEIIPGDESKLKEKNK